MKKLILIIAVAVIALFAVRSGRIFPQGDKSISGIPEPVQGPANVTYTLEKDGGTAEIKCKATYEINALVVSTKNYRGGNIFDELAPVDAALCWGTVAEKNGDIDFHWSQSNRWYYWYISGEDAMKVSNNEVNTQSANNHLVPANDSVEKLVKKIKTGDHILITGYLVDITAQLEDGRVYTNQSSTSRNDTGDGACEIIYVTSVKWL